MDAEKTTQTSQECQILTFKLADHKMGFMSSDVSAVIRLITITPLARTADFFAGMINLRGHLTPVIDLRSLFKLPVREPDAQTCLIAVKGKGHPLCVISDRFPALIKIETKRLEEPPEILFDQFVETVYKMDEELTLILNARKLVNPEQIREIMTQREEELKLII